MAIITLRKSAVDVVIAPFDANQASYNASVQWSPADRPDVRDQAVSLEDTVQAGHPLAAPLSRIRSAAETFLTNRFGERGESLTTSPVSSFTLSFSFAHPQDFAADGVELRAVAVWKPIEYPNARAQVELLTQQVPGGHALISDFAALADHVRDLATGEYGGQHSIAEPAR